MDNHCNTSSQTRFRFTSIEPIEPLNPLLKDIAEIHGCHFEIRSNSVYNAPFCGVDYHVEEVALQSFVQQNHSHNIASCVEQFARIESEKLADGYFEIIG